MTGFASDALLKEAKAGDKSACGQLVEENTGLIWSVVRKFFGRGVEPDDLYQLGCLGFLKAVQGFDPNFGTQFSTYAVPKISGEIRRFLRDDGSIKVSRSIKERAALIQCAKASLRQSLNREPVLSELAEKTGLAPEEIAVCETAMQTPESLQKQTGEDGYTLEHMLSGSYEEDRLIEYVALKEAVRRLPEKERSVIMLRFYRGFTQDKASKILGVSQVQVSRIERRAVETLRRMLE